ncbi:MAG: PEP-CTERM sorting domain-containing protein, partial [Pseudomonadota bacterium]
VFATIIGANGVGTLSNVYLWDIGTITGATSFAGVGTYNTELSGLSITTEGFNLFVKSLGLLTTGKNALAGVTDYGTISSTIIATAAPVPAVPEPATYAYLIGGLAIVGMSLRRRAK